MKRKETKPSPVATKKGRKSIVAEIASPEPLSIEEQRKRAREWAENEAKKMASATASKSRSTTPTTKTPAKKAKVEPAPEPELRSTRKSVAGVRSETPARSTRKVKEVVKEESESESESESEEEEPTPVVAAPAVRNRKTPAKSKPAEPTPAARQTPKATPAPTTSSSSKATPKSTVKKETQTPARAKTPVLQTNTSSGSGIKSANSSRNSTPRMVPLPSEPERSPSVSPRETRQQKQRREEKEQSALTTDGEGDTCDASSCAVTMALTAGALSVIGYYDWKIALTTLTVVVVLGALRRIFKMIGASEDALPAEVGTKGAVASALF